MLMETVNKSTQRKTPGFKTLIIAFLILPVQRLFSIKNFVPLVENNPNVISS